VHLFSLIIISKDYSSELSVSHAESQVTSARYSAEIYLIDTIGRRIYADGLMLVTDEIKSDVSFLIPEKNYLLKMQLNVTQDRQIRSAYYIVKVSEFESGFTYQIKWKKIMIDPSARIQEFEISLQFEQGIYKIEVFLWHDLQDPEVLLTNPDLLNSVIKAITIETNDKRYQMESDNTVINSTQKFIYKNEVKDNITQSEVIMDSGGYIGSNWGGLISDNKIILEVSSERTIYGDIVYFDIKKQEWIIVKQDLARNFKISVQIPKEQDTNNFKWGTYIFNPNTIAIRTNVTTIITNYK
jgi:hypothetical protein